MGVLACDMHVHLLQKQPNLKLNTWTKQLLGFLLLVSALTIVSKATAYPSGLAYFIATRTRKEKRFLSLTRSDKFVHNDPLPPPSLFNQTF
jgi:hypothetical protein